MMRSIVSTAKAHLDLTTGILFFIVGVSIYILSYSHAQGPSDWSLSPGFFPRLSAGFIIALSLLHIILSLKGNKQEQPLADNPEASTQSKYVVLITMAVIVAYPYVMEYFGFLLASFLGIAILMRLYGMTKWIIILLLSISIPLCTHYLALKFMYILFPTGTLMKKIF